MAFFTRADHTDGHGTRSRNPPFSLRPPAPRPSGTDPPVPRGAVRRLRAGEDHRDAGIRSMPCTRRSPLFPHQNSVTSSPSNQQQLDPGRISHQRSSTRPAFSAKSGSRGKIWERACHGLIASWCSQRRDRRLQPGPSAGRDLLRQLGAPGPATARAAHPGTLMLDHDRGDLRQLLDLMAHRITDRHPLAVTENVPHPAPRGPVHDDLVHRHRRQQLPAFALMPGLRAPRLGRSTLGPTAGLHKEVTYAANGLPHATRVLFGIMSGRTRVPESCFQRSS